MQKPMLAALMMVLLPLSACSEDNTDTTGTEEKTSVKQDQTNKTAEQPYGGGLKKVTAQEENETITVTGTIVLKAMEGGFWGFDGDNGQKYMPHGIDKQYLQPGLVVKITGIVDKDMMTFQQYGYVLKVKSVEIVDDSNVGKTDTTY